MLILWVLQVLQILRIFPLIFLRRISETIYIEILWFCGQCTYRNNFEKSYSYAVCCSAPV